MRVRAVNLKGRATLRGATLTTYTTDHSGSTNLLIKCYNTEGVGWQANNPNNRHCPRLHVRIRGVYHRDTMGMSGGIGVTSDI